MKSRLTVKGTLLLLLILGLVGLSAERSWEARKWKKAADHRGYLSERAALYLFGETEVLDPAGHKMRRVDILDALIARTVQQQQKR